MENLTWHFQRRLLYASSVEMKGTLPKDVLLPNLKIRETDDPRRQGPGVRGEPY